MVAPNTQTMNKQPRNTKALWITFAIFAILAFALILFVVGLTVPMGAPEEFEAVRDFLREHPTYSIERVVAEEREVVGVSYRFFYRIPNDSRLYETALHYIHQDGSWKITH